METIDPSAAARRPGRSDLLRAGRWVLGGALVAVVAARLDAARRRAERAFVEALRSTTTAQELVAAGTVGVIEGEEDRILRANPAFCDMLGYAGDVVDRGALRWTELTPPGWDDVDRRLLVELDEVGRAGPAEKAYRHADGHDVHVLISVVRLEAEPFRWVAFVADISDRQAAAARLVAQAESSLELARALAQGRTVDHLARVATSPISGLVGATYCNVGVVRGEHVRVFQEWGVDEAGPPFVEVPLEARRPMTAAVRTRQEVWVRSAQDLVARFPDLAEETVRAGVSALVVLPLWSSDQQLLGALTIAWVEPPTWAVEGTPDAEARARLALIGEIMGTALERALLVEREREVSLSLQLGLLGDPGAVPGVEAAGRYLPSERGTRVGGDLTDVVALGDGRVAVVVGDIVGHGSQAAATMGQLRTAVRLLLRTTDGPAAVMDGLVPFLDDVAAARYSSLFVVVLDRHDATIAYAGAGHPPPVLHDGQRAVLLDGAQNSLLGVAEGGASQRCVPLPPACTLVLYSDGLVEDRATPITDGIDRLARLVDRHAVLSVDELADELLVRMAPKRVDDTALVVVRPQP